MPDVEVNLNNQPSTYIEEDLEYSVLAQNSVILGRDIKLPDYYSEEEEVSDNWKKWQGYVYKCKEAAWKRWVHEYLVALRERHKRRREGLGKVQEYEYVYNQNKYREERYWKPIQLLYPVELHCDSKSVTNNTQDDRTMNNNAEKSRPKRSEAPIAEQRIRDIEDNENGGEQCENLKATYNLMNYV